MTESPWGNINGLPLLYPKAVADQFRRQGLPVGDWFDKANGFRCPLGQEPGQAWVLATRRVVDQIRNAGDMTLSLGIGTQKVEFPSLLFVRAERLTPGASDDESAPFLVELADIRVVLRLSFVDASYNVRPSSDPGGDYFEGTRNEGVDWTWETMLENLWDHLSVARAGTWPGLPFTPGGTPEGFMYHGMSAWKAIGDALSYIGCAVKFDPFDSSFSIVEAGTDDGSLSGLQQAWRNDLIRDSEAFEGAKAKYPSTLWICFPANYGGSEEDTVESPYHPISYTIVEFKTDSGITLDSDGGTSFAVIDSTEAEFAGGAGSEIVNLTALQERASEVGQQWYRVRSLSQATGPRHSWMYRGLIGAFVPGEQIGEVWWKSGASGCTTSVLRYTPRRRENRSAVQIWNGESEGILVSTLSGPLCLYDEPTSATVQPLDRDVDTRELLSPDEVSSSDLAEEVTVYNSDPDLTGVVGAYCRWRVIGGIRQFTYVGCEDATAGCDSSSSSTASGGA